MALYSIALWKWDACRSFGDETCDHTTIVSLMAVQRLGKTKRRHDIELISLRQSDVLYHPVGAPLGNVLYTDSRMSHAQWTARFD